MVINTIVGVVLFFSAPCPISEEVAGCVFFENPPVIYVDPKYNKPTKKYVFQHEIGHIACLQIPGCPLWGEPNEEFARNYAACHISKKTLQKVWLFVGKCYG